MFTSGLSSSLCCLLVLISSGCSSERFEFVKAQSLAEVRDSKNCGESVLPNYGCWRELDMRGGCKIIVEWPKSTADERRLQTLGLEVWKCIEKNREY